LWFDFMQAQPLTDVAYDFGFVDLLASRRIQRGPTLPSPKLPGAPLFCRAAFGATLWAAPFLVDPPRFKEPLAGRAVLSD
jgi:hypothetical protein